MMEVCTGHIIRGVSMNKEEYRKLKHDIKARKKRRIANRKRGERRRYGKEEKLITGQ